MIQNTGLLDIRSRLLSTTKSLLHELERFYEQPVLIVYCLFPAVGD